MTISYALTLWRVKETNVSVHYYQLFSLRTHLSRIGASPAAYRAGRPLVFLTFPHGYQLCAAASEETHLIIHRCPLLPAQMQLAGKPTSPNRRYRPSHPRFIIFSAKRPSFSRLLPAVPLLVPFCVTARYVRVAPLRLRPVSRSAAQVSPAFASSRFTACSSGVMYTVCWWV